MNSIQYHFYKRRTGILTTNGHSFTIRVASLGHKAMCIEMRVRSNLVAFHQVDMEDCSRNVAIFYLDGNADKIRQCFGSNYDEPKMRGKSWFVLPC